MSGLCFICEKPLGDEPAQRDLEGNEAHVACCEVVDIDDEEDNPDE